MKNGFFSSCVMITLATFGFQACGVDGESALIGSGSSSSRTDRALPVLTADKSNVTVTTNLVLTGACDVKNYQEYFFELEFKGSGSQSSGVFELNQKCVSRRYSLTINSSDFHSFGGTSGTVSIKILVPRFQLESDPVSVTIAVGGGTGDSTGGSSGGTTGTSCDSLPLPPKTVGPFCGYILLSEAASKIDCSNGTYGQCNNPGWLVVRNGTPLHDGNQYQSGDKKYISESLWAACERKALCHD